MTLGSTMFSRRGGRRQTRGEDRGEARHWSWHASFDSLPSTHAIQTAVATCGPGGGKSCDGLMARLHDACCSGARFNVYPQSIKAPGKNSLYAGGGCIPLIPLCIRPCLLT